ncbi:MAG TPA: cytochrome c biogenesis protein CcdA, partial [Thermoanaerobaculia bacterium]|nr:cytochrome c biogenesis protein CcdA [Thermoanaerobaculia bacterium]
MRTRPFRVPAVAVAVLAFGVALAGWAQPPDLEKASLTLAADRTAYEPGSAAVVVARVTVEDGWHVNAHVPTYDYLIPTELTLHLPEGWTAGAVTYPDPEMQTFIFAEEPLAVYDGVVEIRAALTVPPAAAAGSYPLRATLGYQACDQDQCLPPTEAEAGLELTVGSGGVATAGTAPGGGAADAAGVDSRSRLSAAGFAILLGLLGGLILNAMPCVLPVLSLKVFGLVQSAGQGRREVVRGALATAAGIVVSFWALAAAAAAARAAGSAVGWGVQFQRPGFVAFLAVVVVLFCLNLWGLFEITLPWRVARVAGAAPREGVAGHFATGLFATLMATPCSAPFLGTAVGFALGQEIGTVIAVFTAIGIGMALPYLLLAAWPGAARLLPRPGPWMDTLKGTMGFFLAAAAVWLLYVLASQVSAERRAAIELAL